MARPDSRYGVMDHSQCSLRSLSASRAATCLTTPREIVKCRLTLRSETKEQGSQELDEKRPPSGRMGCLHREWMRKSWTIKETLRTSSFKLFHLISPTDLRRGIWMAIESSIAANIFEKVVRLLSLVVQTNRNPQRQENPCEEIPSAASTCLWCTKVLKSSPHIRRAFLSRTTMHREMAIHLGWKRCGPKCELAKSTRLVFKSKSSQK